MPESKRPCDYAGCGKTGWIEGYKGSLKVWACDDHAKDLEDVLGNPLTPEDVEQLKESVRASVHQLAELKKSEAAWKSEARLHERKFLELRQKAQSLEAAASGQYWAWSGDGTDHPESLSKSCRVVMTGEQLTDILGQIHNCPTCGMACKQCQCVEKKIEELHSIVDALMKFMEGVNKALDTTLRFGHRTMWSGGSPAHRELKQLLCSVRERLKATKT